MAFHGELFSGFFSIFTALVKIFILGGQEQVVSAS